MFRLLLGLIVLSASVEVFALQIKVPVFMTGVAKDVTALKGDYYVYSIDGMFTQKSIVPKLEKNSSIEELISTLYFTYSTNNKEMFRTLFTPAALQSINKLSPEKFNKRWLQYSSKKDTSLHFYFSYKNGYVIGLKAPGDKMFNIQYAIKVNEKWIFELFEGDAKDPRFNNVSLWLTFQPLEVTKASLLKTFKADDPDKVIEAQVKNRYLTLFRKGKESWEMVGQVKDNDKEYSTWPDLNSVTGFIKIRLTDGFLDTNVKNELLVMESNFPILYYPLSLEKTGQFSP